MDVSLTYSISNDSGSKFYDQLSLFTDKILDEAKYFFKQEIEGYWKFVASENLDQVRTTEEYLLEFIAIGILLEQHAKYAAKSNRIGEGTVSVLYNLRNKSTYLKPYADGLRGYLSSFLLYRKAKGAVEFSNIMFARLIKWMRATGEFKEMVGRLTKWAFYFSVLDEFEADLIINRSVAFSKYFNEQAKIYLGKYTKNVSYFLDNEHKLYKYREDFLFCGKNEIEYHLNFFGAEVLNRVLKYNFDQTESKTLLLPTCMCSPKTGECKSVKNGLLISCASCNENCSVNQVSKNMKEKSNNVYLMPHSSYTSELLMLFRNQNHTGIIGVACALNLIEGGYELQRLNVPAQCVYLNYSGCKKHWHATGIPTNIEIGKLQKVVQKTEFRVFEKAG
jgi:uncharacterized protein